METLSSICDSDRTTVLRFKMGLVAPGADSGEIFNLTKLSSEAEGLEVVQSG